MTGSKWPLYFNRDRIITFKRMIDLQANPLLMAYIYGFVKIFPL